MPDNSLYPGAQFGITVPAEQGSVSRAPTIPPIPTTGNLPQPQYANLDQALQNLTQMLDQVQGQYRPKVSLPQQVPRQVQAGDLSRNYVNPNQPGGAAYNRRVTLAQSIGQSFANIDNQYNERKARDVAFNAQRIEDYLTNPTPENQAAYQKLVFKNGINAADGLTKEAKDVQKALHFSIPTETGEKVDDYIKNARNKIQQQQQRQPQAQAAPLGSQQDVQGRQQLDQLTQQAQQAPGAAQAQAPPWQPSGAYAAMLRQFPQTFQMSPQLQMQAELTKIGMLPSGDAKVKYLADMAKDDTRWQIWQNVIQQRDLDSLRRMFASGKASEERLAAATLMAKAGITRAGITVGGVDRRTQAIIQNFDNSIRAKAEKDVIDNQANIVKERIKADEATIGKGEDKVGSEAIDNAKKDKESMKEYLKQLENTSKQMLQNYQGYVNAGNAAISASGDTGTAGLSAADQAFANQLTSGFPSLPQGPDYSAQDATIESAEPK